MIDLHIHSIFSDGELIPSEIVSRAKKQGYRALALTDHVDTSNITFVIPNMVKVSKDLTKGTGIKVLPGVEITHVPPILIPELVKEARSLGASIVVVHGETIVEPVPHGTNREAIMAGADILAHPGLITEEEASLAAAHGVLLEITSRRGHSLSNGHVVKMAKKSNAGLIFNTDAHSPEDFVTIQEARDILLGAALDDAMVNAVFKNSETLLVQRS